MKKIIAILCVLAIALGFAGCGATKETEKTSGTSNSPTVNNEDTTKAEATLLDYVIKINGKEYKLPFAVSDFVADGWKLSDAGKMEEDLTAGQFIEVSFALNGNANGTFVHAEIENTSKSTKKVKDCQILTLGFSKADIRDDGFTVVFAKGITLGSSTMEDVVAAYGKADVENDALNGLEYTYKNSSEENDNRGYVFKFERGEGYTNGPLQSVVVSNY